MTRTFNNASFEGSERITDELIAALADEQPYEETEADILAEAHFDAWLLRQDEAGFLDLTVYA